MLRFPLNGVQDVDFDAVLTEEVSKHFASDVETDNRVISVDELNAHEK